jgi:hypothetical protein
VSSRRTYSAGAMAGRPPAVSGQPGIAAIPHTVRRGQKCYSAAAEHGRPAPGTTAEPSRCPSLTLPCDGRSSVQVLYAPAPKDHEATHIPVPGSAELTEVDRSNGDEMRSRNFRGYLVDILTSDGD